MIGGVYVFATSDNDDDNNDDDDDISKQLKKYCESLEIDNATNDEIICKLKR